jgi:hypothetical protein
MAVVGTRGKDKTLGFYKRDERRKGELVFKEVDRRNTTKIVTFGNFSTRNGIC